MKPEMFIGWARELLDHSDFGDEGVWPRTVAFLARQGLETGIDEFWDQIHLREMTSTTRFTQLACIGQYLDNDETVSGIRNAWGSLSRACHHHPYELAPTASELDVSLSQVEALLNRLRASPHGDL